MNDIKQTQYEKEDIKKIAKNQKIICWLFLVIIVSIFTISLVIPILSYIGASIAVIFYVYYLAVALKVKHPALYVVGMFFPLIKLFVLWNLIQKATKVLQAHNVKVGVMGYKKEDLDKFLAE